MDVSHVPGAWACLPFSRPSGPLGVSRNIRWILPSFSVGVFEMWERKRLTDL